MQACASVQPAASVAAPVVGRSGPCYLVTWIEVQCVRGGLACEAPRGFSAAQAPCLWRRILTCAPLFGLQSLCDYFGAQTQRSPCVLYPSYPPTCRRTVAPTSCPTKALAPLATFHAAQHMSKEALHAGACLTTPSTTHCALAQMWQEIHRAQATAAAPTLLPAARCCCCCCCCRRRFYVPPDDQRCHVSTAAAAASRQTCQLIKPGPTQLLTPNCRRHRSGSASVASNGDVPPATQLGTAVPPPQCHRVQLSATGRAPAAARIGTSAPPLQCRHSAEPYVLPTAAAHIGVAVPFRQRSTMPERLGFSSAAATRSLSFSCLLTAASLAWPPGLTAMSTCRGSWDSDQGLHCHESIMAHWQLI